MKLHLGGNDGRYYFSAYGDDHVQVNGQRFDFGLVLGTSLLDQEAFDGVTFETLETRHFDWLATQNAEIILLGTGPRIRFPPHSLTRALMEAHIGLEVMDTGAVCRTYNVLAGEGRKVVAVILA